MLAHKGCGGEVYLDPSKTYDYEVEDEKGKPYTTQVPAHRCRKCKQEITGDIEIEEVEDTPSPKTRRTKHYHYDPASGDPYDDNCQQCRLVHAKYLLVRTEETLELALVSLQAARKLLKPIANQDEAMFNKIDKRRFPDPEVIQARLEKLKAYHKSKGHKVKD
jgi:hypothetical protein